MEIRLRREVMVNNNQYGVMPGKSPALDSFFSRVEGTVKRCYGVALHVNLFTKSSW